MNQIEAAGKINDDYVAMKFKLSSKLQKLHSSSEEESSESSLPRVLSAPQVNKRKPNSS